jgi:hypothetical protein
LFLKPSSLTVTLGSLKARRTLAPGTDWRE